MASLRRPTILPQCTSCSRRFAEFALDGWRPTQQHVRGKKKMPNRSETIHVKLLQDVATYGKKGSIVPVTRGVMRNHWHGQRLADYVPYVQLRSLRQENASFERDFDFGSRILHGVPLESLGSTAKALPSVQRATIEQLSPQRTYELLQIFVPPTITFNRTPISKDTSEPTPISNNVDLSSSPSSPSPPTLVQIHGSVSPSDIAVAIKRALAANDEASLAQIAESDIRFVYPDTSPIATDVKESNRIKHLGDYEIDIHVKGLEGEKHEGILRRKIRVAV